MFFRNSLSENLDNFFKNLKPNPKYEIMNFTIGEPKFSTPKMVTDELKESSYLLKKYATTKGEPTPVSYTHLRAHETEADLVCRLLLE